MGRLRRLRVTRDRIAFGLTAATCIAGAIGLAATAPSYTDPFVLPLRAFRLATGGALIALAFLTRRWPGVTAMILVFATMQAGDAVMETWFATQWSDPTSGSGSGTAPPPVALAALGVVARLTVPSAIFALYATSPERRLASWVPPVAWFVVLLTIVAAALRAQGEWILWADPNGWWPWQLDAASDVDTPTTIFFVGALGLIGSLRSAARRYRPSVIGGDERPAGPDRAIAAAVSTIGILWIPAVIAFINRPHALDASGDGSDRWAWLPILLVLVGIVVSRWSRLAAWAAISGGFQAVAILVLYRAGDGVVRLALALGPDMRTPITPEYVLLTSAGVLIQAFAFAALAVSVLAAWREERSRAMQIRWALLGALLGICVCVWYVAGSALAGSFPWATEVLLLPASPCLAVVLALGLWRRLVPGVAEAEAIATRPLRPLRYLETIVAEVLTERGEHRRNAIAAERARLASTLHAEFLPNLDRLATQNAAGASREEVTERLRELQDEVRRLMAERRLVVLEEFGIIEALEWLVSQAEERGPFAVELTVDDASTSDRPPREVERAAFRIAQLAVENAIQHAGPTRLALHVLASSDRVSISVADDGHWVEPPSDERRRDHVGIADMRSEASQVRGAVELVPSDGGGTTVQFAWPAVAAAPSRTTAPATGGAG